MSIGKYILVNGQFVVAEEYRLAPAEFGGILFSEKIRAVRTAFPFFAETLELIKLKLLIFNRSFPEFTRDEGSELKRQLRRTLVRNKHFMGAVFTLTFSLTNSKMTYSIRSEKLPFTDYDLNEKGIYVSIFEKIQKPVSALSNLTVGSEMYWNVTRLHLDQTQADCLLILNTHDEIVESPESNVYLIRGTRVRGASVEQGAYHDVTRPFMLEIFKNLNLEYSESEGITIDDIRDADEFFVVNSIEGIRWIVGFEGKRFFNNTIRRINELFRDIRK